jgi:hypothetical protein
MHAPIVGSELREVPADATIEVLLDENESAVAYRTAVPVVLETVGHELDIAPRC